MPSTGPFQYSAFITCHPADAAFARELQRFLEHYKLPTRLGKQFPHLPDHLRPVFCHRSAPAVTGDDLASALAGSKFLIVITSHTAARAVEPGTESPLDSAIKAFLAANPEVNGRRIIPVLYREKGGARPTECMTPGVKDCGVLAADILDKGKARTFSDVAAKMLGLSPDKLWNDWEREQEAQRRNRRLAAGAVAVAALVSRDASPLQYKFRFIEQTAEGIYPQNFTEEHRKIRID